MKYQLTVSQEAQDQLYACADWWAEHRSVDEAMRWLEGFELALPTLEVDPERLPLAPEADRFPFKLRQLTYGLGRKRTHRALFEVRGSTVIVHSIRHLAQRELSSDDLFEV